MSKFDYLYFEEYTSQLKLDYNKTGRILAVRVKDADFSNERFIPCLGSYYWEKQEEIRVFPVGSSHLRDYCVLVGEEYARKTDWAVFDKLISFGWDIDAETKEL